MYIGINAQNLKKWVRQSQDIERLPEPTLIEIICLCFKYLTQVHHKLATVSQLN